jgi:hypothetical protein
MAKITPTHFTRPNACYLVNTDYGELQCMRFGTAPNATTLLPNAGRFCEFGAKSLNGAQRQRGIKIILLFNVLKENRLQSA